LCVSKPTALGKILAAYLVLPALLIPYLVLFLELLKACSLLLISKGYTLGVEFWSFIGILPTLPKKLRPLVLSGPVPVHQER
jgi:hypothetical protein